MSRFSLQNGFCNYDVERSLLHVDEAEQAQRRAHSASSNSRTESELTALPKTLNPYSPSRLRTRTKHKMRNKRAVKTSAPSIHTLLNHLIQSQKETYKFVQYTVVVAATALMFILVILVCLVAFKSRGSQGMMYPPVVWAQYPSMPPPNPLPSK